MASSSGIPSSMSSSSCSTPNAPSTKPKAPGKRKSKTASESSGPGGKRKKNWGHPETVGLISIWGSEEHQAGFEGMMYNSRVWASILNKFSAQFPESLYTTWESLKDRMDYLRRKYREAKKVNNTSGRGRLTSPYYEEIDQIIGKRPMNNCKSHHHMDADSGDDADGPEASNELSTEPLTPQSPSTELIQKGDSDIDMEDAEDDAADTSGSSLDSVAQKEKDQTTKDSNKPGTSGLQFRKRRGKKTQVEDALDKAIRKLIDFQQKQQDESVCSLLKMEQERFLWEKEQQNKREEKEERWRQEKFDLEERKMKSSNDLILQLASMFGNKQQGPSYQQNPRQIPQQNPRQIPQQNTRQIPQQNPSSLIPPYYNHDSFLDL